jgi:signal transduction histidine kinase
VTFARIDPLTDPRLSILDQLDRIIWIADIDVWQIVWGNRAALAFWSEPSIESLIARPQGVTSTILPVHFQIRDRLRTEEHVHLEHTVYPDGAEPVHLRMAFSKYALPDGRAALLVEAEPVPLPDPDMVRDHEAMRYAPLIVTTHMLDGTTLSANALARLTFGQHFGFVELFERPQAAEALLARLVRGEVVASDVRVRTVAGLRWYAMEMRRFADPVSGAEAFLMIAHDITARREAEQAKDQLVSVVSHELRTPLTSIRGALDLLASVMLARDSETQDEMVRIARENTARLGKLVEDLLDVQRLAAGVLVLSRAPVDLCDLVAKTIDQHRPAGQAAGVTFSLTARARPTLDIDASRIQQVLGNLLSNAVKHSARGSVVRVDVQRRGGWIRVTVTDEGPGVPSSFRKRIFTPFTQADGSDARPLGGAGLGLYIAKTLIEKHNGVLGYDEELARGARFYFDLPAAAEAPARE